MEPCCAIWESHMLCEKALLSFKTDIDTFFAVEDKNKEIKINRIVRSMPRFVWGKSLDMKNSNFQILDQSKL